MSRLSNNSALDLFVSRLLGHSELGQDEREALADLPAARVEVGANRDLVHLGETVNHACLVERGLLGKFGQTERQYVSLHIPGEMPDLQSMIVPQADAAINSLTKSTVLRVPHHALHLLADRYPAIAEAFSRDCVVQAEIVARWLVNVGRRDSRTRMSHLFCEMALRYGRHGHSPALRYELPMTQDQLADALGLTPVHVNRTLMSLREDQLVAFSRGIVEIPNWAALAAVAEFDPTYLHLPNGEREA